MAESSLSVGYPELVRAVGRFLGYGADSSSWQTGQLEEVQDHIASGLRRFYGAHQWSFLRPTHTITLVAATATYALPDNFAAFLGDFTFTAESLKQWSVPLVPELVVRRRRTSTPRSGTPEMAAVYPITVDGTTGQRFELALWPTPDAAGTLTAAMQILPDKVTAAAPYPLGGEKFAEAILECCLAAAESTMDDAQAVHAERAVQELQLAIGADDRHRSISTLGYNGDPSIARAPVFRRSNGFTYNGAPT